VQSAHVVRRRTGRPDWSSIVMLYDALAALTGSAVVAINRAVAAGGLRALDGIADDPRVAGSQC
jgi:RNA polymerase sigma-70 factor (ECF subfamily)